MPDPAPRSAAPRTRTPRDVAAVMLLSIVIALTAAVLFDRPTAHLSLFSLTNLVGPTVRSLLAGQGLFACTNAMTDPHNVVCFHAARMPMATLVLAAGVRLFGDRFLPVALFKAALFLLPIELALWLAAQHLPTHRTRRRLALALLLAPFLMLPFLADVVNIQVEEGYAFAFLALAFALVVFRAPPRGLRAHNPLRQDAWLEGLLVGLCVPAMYLSKSSLAPAAAVLGLAYLLRARATAPRALVLVLGLAAPLGWASWQHHASGHWSLGTSLDGINLHKGSNPDFLNEYPPAPGHTLDQYDGRLNAGMTFATEWQFDAWHRRAAIAFLRQHPLDALRGSLRKLEVFLVSLHKVGSARTHGVQQLAETASLVLFRLLLWTALAASALALWRPGPLPRSDAALFLALTAAIALPYLLGFAYTRHASILIQPAVLLCFLMLTSARPAHSPLLR